MPAIDEKTLKQHIKDKSLARVYLLYGNEDFLKKHYASRICDAVVPKALRTMNFTELDGSAVKIEDISDAVEVLPFGGNKRCVQVVDLDVNSLSKGEENKLLQMLKDPPESCVLVIWLNLVEADAKRSAKWRKLISAVQEVGCTIKLDKRDTQSLIRLLIKWADSRGCVLSSANARFIVELCGDEITILQNELEKLCSYTGHGEITREIIKDVSIRTLSTSVFDMSRALVRNDYDSAFGLLDDLMAMRQEPVAILAVLSSAFVDMYRAKVAANSGLGVNEIAKEFGYSGKEFRLRNAARDCAHVSVSQLRKSLDILLKTDLKLKSTRLDGRVALEQALGQLLLLYAEEASIAK